MFERVKKAVTRLFKGPETQLKKVPTVISKSRHGIDPRLVSFAARRTCELLQQRGYKAYIVGGAVRDLMLGVQPKDFDVATNATPEQVKRCQRRAYIIGRRFRLVHVVFGQEIIECSTFRALDADGVRKDADGRVISDNVFGEMWEDAARRDFTINALYYDPTSEEIYDYHNGFEDISARCLRMIGDPMERYREDPVRMMRAVRISAKLGFKMERATEKAIPRMASLLENVPAARLFDEVMKLMTCGHAEQCLINLRKEGLHRSLLPMLDVILSEEDGEKFLMLALHRTDERIAAGKKISPAFMFATLLWPQVKKRWDAYQAKGRMPRATALYKAAEEVISTQSAKLAIHNRYAADMKLIWVMQIRFERRTGKNPFALITHVKYRACYDFLLLRSLLGHVPADLVRWWETFVASSEEERRAMVDEQEALARRTGSEARAGHARRQAVESRAEQAVLDSIEEQRNPRRARYRRERVRQDAEPTEPLDQGAPSTEQPAGEPQEAVKPRRTRRRRSSAAAETPVQQTEAEQSAAPAQEQGAVAEEEPKPRRTRRRRTAAAAEVPVQQPEAEQSAAPVKDAAEPAQEETKPRRTRRRKTAAAAEAPVQQPEAEQSAAPAKDAGEPAQEEVKPRRPRRRKTAAAPEASGDGQPAGESGEQYVQVETNPELMPPKPRRRRTTSKPKAEAKDDAS